MARDQLITFVVNKEERQEVERLSKLCRRSMSDAIRYAVAKELSRLEAEQQVQIEPATNSH